MHVRPGAYQRTLTVSRSRREQPPQHAIPAIATRVTCCADITDAVDVAVHHRDCFLDRHKCLLGRGHDLGAQVSLLSSRAQSSPQARRSRAPVDAQSQPLSRLALTLHPLPFPNHPDPRYCPRHQSLALLFPTACAHFPAPDYCSHAAPCCRDGCAW